MYSAISTWILWGPYRLNISLEQRMQMAKETGATICIKGQSYTSLWGVKENVVFSLPGYKGKSNDDLEQLAKANNIGVDLWTSPSLKYPAQSALSVQQAVARWNPKRVFLDIEGEAGQYPTNTGSFLRSLGRLSCKVYLQSHRKPKLHPEIVWNKWFSYGDSGQYFIDGNAPMDYPVGWVTEQQYIDDADQMVEQYSTILKSVGREDMEWVITLPSYTESGWMPNSQYLGAMMEHLMQEDVLGKRVRGFNFWRQQFLFDSKFSGFLTLISWVSGIDETPEPSTIPVDQFVIEEVYPGMVDKWFYDGPKPA